MEFKSLCVGLSVAFWFAAAGGCAHPSFLEQRTDPARADLKDKVIHVPPAPPHVDIVNPNPSGPGGALILPTEVTGTWTFTTPPTVTQIEHRTGQMDQFSLYMGRPAGNDMPFVLITVARDQKSIAESDPATYQISNQRDYVMNGNIVHEWSGLSKSGAGFSELLIRRPGVEGQTGDTCHAMAVVKSPDEQKLALDILASLVWRASR